jgi:hypothetical protein
MKYFILPLLAQADHHQSELKGKLKGTGIFRKVRRSCCLSTTLLRIRLALGRQLDRRKSHAARNHHLNVSQYNTNLHEINNILRHADPLLGNDRELSKYATADSSVTK